MATARRWRRRAASRCSACVRNESFFSCLGSLVIGPPRDDTMSCLPRRRIGLWLSSAFCHRSDCSGTHASVAGGVRTPCLIASVLRPLARSLPSPASVLRATTVLW